MSKIVLNKTTILNSVWYVVSLILVLYAEVPQTFIASVPAPWNHYILVVVAVAAWLKSHKNLFQNPDGTSAMTAYLPPK